MTDIAVIGLGAMGRPIARNLLAAGHQVSVWNRSPGPVEQLVALGAKHASTIEEAMGAEVTFSMLADDRAVAEVFLDSGVLADVSPGHIHVNLATVSARLARRAAAVHAAEQLEYVSAPVFGRAPVAEAAGLHILAAGDATAIENVQHLFDVIGVRTWVLGEHPEQANIVKILGNYLIAAAIQSLGEAVSVAERSEVDADRFVELMTSTLFPGQVYESYGALVSKRRYQPAAFTTRLGRKDLLLALEAAADREVALPFGDVLGAVFERAIREGRADDDWASIVELQPRGRVRPRGEGAC